MATTFKDGTGRKWSLVVTCGTMMRFERETGSSLFDPKMFKEIQAGVKVLNILHLAYFAAEKGAPEKNISFEEFCESITDAAQMRAMCDAAGEALTLFFQSHENGAVAKTSKS